MPRSPPKATRSAAFDAGLAELEPLLGARHQLHHQRRRAHRGAQVVERSPIDNDIVIGRFAEAAPADVDDAVAPPPRREPSGRRHRGRSGGAARQGADLISERRNRIAALLTLEVGKNRLESLGDVEETADLIRYYTHQLAEHDGFAQPMGRLNPAEATPT